jgi:hypothetical protein
VETVKNEEQQVIVTDDGVQVRCAFDQLCLLVDLKPRPDNPNQHPDAQIALLAKIITAQGWRSPIVVSTRSGHITKGHGRLLAAQLAGMTVAPIDLQAYDSDESEIADVLADNQIAELSSIDTELLRDNLQLVDTGVIDLELTGFSMEEIEQHMTAAADAPPEPLQDACSFRVACATSQELKMVRKVFGVTESVIDAADLLKMMKGTET